MGGDDRGSAEQRGVELPLCSMTLCIRSPISLRGLLLPHYTQFFNLAVPTARARALSFSLSFSLSRPPSLSLSLTHTPPKQRGHGEERRRQVRCGGVYVVVSLMGSMLWCLSHNDTHSKKEDTETKEGSKGSVVLKGCRQASALHLFAFLPLPFLASSSASFLPLLFTQCIYMR